VVDAIALDHFLKERDCPRPHLLGFIGIDSGGTSKGAYGGSHKCRS
jgi:hypothetical protein